MSYKGPYMLFNRSSKYIGELLHPWWFETLYDAQKEGTIVAYNYKTDSIWFIVPGYTTAPYTNGIIFVFDLRAFKINQELAAWYYFKSDIDIVHRTINLACKT